VFAIHTIILSPAHVTQAEELAAFCYALERLQNPLLPDVRPPGLAAYAAEQRGVVALSGETMLGFMCWEKPRDSFFGNCRGSWTPVHAHGAVVDNRAAVYDYLYQHMANLHVAERIMTHAVTLYAHDLVASGMFFQNGFGMRCIDAIRSTEPIDAEECEGIIFRQAEAGDAAAIADMNNALIDHLNESPIFMAYYYTFTPGDIAKGISDGKYRYTLATRDQKPIAYLRMQESGETFVADHASMWNISGAFTIADERGRGVSTALLDWTLALLRAEGYALCGVDSESFNPTARRFWGKHFTSYTYSLVRRIDERILALQ